jgi:hypothetical protein
MQTVNELIIFRGSVGQAPAVAGYWAMLLIWLTV